MGPFGRHFELILGSFLELFRLISLMFFVSFFEMVFGSVLAVQNHDSGVLLGFIFGYFVGKAEISD